MRFAGTVLVFEALAVALVLALATTGFFAGFAATPLWQHRVQGEQVRRPLLYPSVPIGEHPAGVGGGAHGTSVSPDEGLQCR